MNMEDTNLTLDNSIPGNAAVVESAEIPEGSVRINPEITEENVPEDQEAAEYNPFTGENPPKSGDTGGRPADAGKTKQNKGFMLREMTCNTSIAIYGLVGELKRSGHTSIGNLIFSETMKMTTAAHLAPEAIGTDKFTEQLENGFYASGKVLVYLNFCRTLAVGQQMLSSVTEMVTSIHKIFGASVKTVKNRSQRNTNTYVNI